MPSPNASSNESKSGSEPTEEQFPAGTDAEQRILSRSLSNAAHDKNKYWYRMGRIMVQEDIGGPEAKKLIERDGSVVHWSDQHLRSIRRTAREVIQSDIDSSSAAKCPFRFASDVLRHVRTGEIEASDANKLLKRRSRHIGTSGHMPFTGVRQKESVHELLDLISEKPQDEQ